VRGVVGPEEESFKSGELLLDGIALEQYIGPSETLLWAGQANKKRILQWAMAVTVFIGTIVLFYSWSAWSSSSLEEACGENPRRACRNVYYTSLPISVILAAGLAYLWFRILAIRAGQFKVVFGITDLRAFTLKTWGSRRFSSVDLDTIDPRELAIRGPFGSIRFGSKKFPKQAFGCLSDEDIERATFAAIYRRPLTSLGPDAPSAAALSAIRLDP
jgi:hypothetical protein